MALPVSGLQVQWLQRVAERRAIIATDPDQRCAEYNPDKMQSIIQRALDWIVHLFAQMNSNYWAYYSFQISRAPWEQAGVLSEWEAFCSAAAQFEGQSGHKVTRPDYSKSDNLEKYKPVMTEAFMTLFSRAYGKRDDGRIALEEEAYRQLIAACQQRLTSQQMNWCNWAGDQVMAFDFGSQSIALTVRDCLAMTWLFVQRQKDPTAAAARLVDVLRTSANDQKTIPTVLTSITINLFLLNSPDIQRLPTISV